MKLIRRVPIQAAVARDRVVSSLLEAQLVSAKAVETAWQHQQDYQIKRPLWRVLADVEGTNASLIFRTAAAVYAFEEANISMVGSQILITKNASLFAPIRWRRLVDNGVFPVREKNDPLDEGVRWTFATYDPSDQQIRRLVSATLDYPYVLRFTEPARLFEVVSECTGSPYIQTVPWYRTYVLGQKSISLVAPQVRELGRAA